MKKRVTAAKSEWEAIKKMHGNRCKICGLTEKQVGVLMKVHIKASSKGGTQVVPVCPNHHAKFDRLGLTKGEAKQLGLDWDKYQKGFYSPKKTPKEETLEGWGRGYRRR